MIDFMKIIKLKGSIKCLQNIGGGEGGGGWKEISSLLLEMTGYDDKLQIQEFLAGGGGGAQ